MAVVGDTLPHCTGTGTSSDPYIYTTAQGFMECIAVTKSYAQAGEENLVFNANDGVIPQSGITIKCNFLNGRGTTIYNLMLQNVSGSRLVNLSYGEYADRHSIEVRNMNFYNMIIIDNNGNNSRFVSASPDDSTYSFFRNCNFTGVAKGAAFGQNALFYWGNNYGPSGRNAFINCTFNINIDIGNSGSSHEKVIFDAYNEYNITNCTICVSGKSYRPIKLLGYFITNNCTFMNKSTNPLILLRSGDAISYSAGSNNIGYNYIKMNIKNTAGTSSFNMTNATKTLVNRSKLTNVDISGTCISMQETDSSASDYIYDAAKLEAAGFLVGQVIE